MEDVQSKAFRQIYVWRTGLMVVAGILFVLAIGAPWAWYAEYITLGIQNLILLGIVALIIAVAYFGSIICHELYEINDQLAGRSSELKEWLGESLGRQ